MASLLSDFTENMASMACGNKHIIAMIAAQQHSTNANVFFSMIPMPLLSFSPLSILTMGVIVSAPPDTNIDMNVSRKLQTEKADMASAPPAFITILLSIIAFMNKSSVLSTEDIPLVQSSAIFFSSLAPSFINLRVRFL